MRQATERGNGKREAGNVPPPITHSPLAIRGFQRFVNALKVIFGMPDYDRYLRHRAERHAGDPVLSPSEFYAQHLKRRYESGGPTRCC